MNQMIIENGQFQIRLGYSNMGNPYIKYDNIIIEREGDYICGPSAEQYSGYRLNWPMQNGIIQDQMQQQKVWDSLFRNYTNLQSNHQSYGINDSVLTYVNNLKQSRCEKQMIFQYFFETQNFVKLNMIDDCYCALLGTGRNSGLVFDYGFSGAWVVPIYQNQYFPQQSLSFDIGGQKLLDFIQSQSTEINLLQSKLIFKQMKKIDKIDFRLPDQQVVICNKSKEFLEQEANGQIFDNQNFSQSLQSLLSKYNFKAQQILLENVVFVGGLNKLSFFKANLKQKLAEERPIKEIESLNPKQPVYFGAYAYAQSSSFQSKLITNQEYKEYGDSIIQRKYKQASAKFINSELSWGRHRKKTGKFSH